jgi:hypothetical protein
MLENDTQYIGRSSTYLPGCTKVPQMDSFLFSSFPLFLFGGARPVLTGREGWITEPLLEIGVAKPPPPFFS